MSAIAAEVPSPVFKSISALAETEGVPVERLASLAIAQAVAVWSQPDPRVRSPGRTG